MRRRIPSRDELTDDTPLRLEVAADLGWPGAGMTAAALRRQIHKGRLAAEFLAGKHWVTLAGIREFRELCRVKVKDPIPMPPKGVAPGRSEEAWESAALAALERIASTPTKRGAGATGHEGRGAYSRLGSKA